MLNKVKGFVIVLPFIQCKHAALAEKTLAEDVQRGYRRGLIGLPPPYKNFVSVHISFSYNYFPIQDVICAIFAQTHISDKVRQH